MEETFARRLTDVRSAGLARRVHVVQRELAGLLALAASERWSRLVMRGRRPHVEASRKAGRMDGMGREIRHAARRLVRSPAFTLAAVLTLGLAIGANASIFTVVHRVVLNPLPYPESQTSNRVGIPPASQGEPEHARDDLAALPPIRKITRARSMRSRFTTAPRSR